MSIQVTNLYVSRLTKLKVDEIIGIKQVSQLTGLKYSSIKSRTFEYYDFPPPLSIEPRPLWLKSDILEYLDIHQQYINGQNKSTVTLVKSWQEHAKECSVNHCLAIKANWTIKQLYMIPLEDLKHKPILIYYSKYLIGYSKLYTKMGGAAYFLLRPSLELS